MGRVSCLVALLAVAVLVTDAYARTIITTVEVEEDNQWPFGRGDRCRQMKPREQLRNCESFLRRQQQQGGRGEEEVEMNQFPFPPRGRGLDECCRELRNVDLQCRCDALGQIAREVQSQGHGQQGRQVLETARNLPLQCGIIPPRCDF